MMNHKHICFDLDGVICKTKNADYANSTPIKKNIRAINILQNKGYIIKIFTARFMGRSKENSRIASKKGLKLSDIIQYIRAMITGLDVSPRIYDIMEILGFVEIKKRIEYFING